MMNGDMMVGLTDDAISYDGMTPFERRELLRESPYGEIADCMLLALDAIDSVVRGSQGPQSQYYVLNDVSLGFFPAVAAVELDVRTKALVALTHAQLIYRFPCALRFGFTDGRVKQLRINSWGRQLCTSDLRRRRSEQYEEMRQQFQEYWAEHSEVYRRLLVGLAKTEFDRIELEQVGRWNENLEVKLVS